MKKYAASNFLKMLIQNFNFSIFTSLFLLSVFPLPGYFHGSPANQTLSGLFVPLGNAAVTGLAILTLNSFLARRNYICSYHPHDKLKLFCIAFGAGLLGYYITASSLATYLISLIIIYTAVMNIRRFAKKLSSLLRQNTLATRKDIGEFANFFINLIISFSVINLSLNTLHNDLGWKPAFNFGDGFAAVIDAFYFSVITITTVGYGNIVPQTLLSRFVVALECLTGYIILGIMIGIITRGITTRKD
ncbi:MAG: ion channel [Alphaproteobacteria bacterium]|nr:ion channel [Alphaproteobacteria bacterium]